MHPPNCEITDILQNPPSILGSMRVILLGGVHGDSDILAQAMIEAQAEIHAHADDLLLGQSEIQAHVALYLLSLRGICPHSEVHTVYALGEIHAYSDMLALAERFGFADLFAFPGIEALLRISADAGVLALLLIQDPREVHTLAGVLTLAVEIHDLAEIRSSPDADFLALAVLSTLAEIPALNEIPALSDIDFFALLIRPAQNEASRVHNASLLFQDTLEKILVVVFFLHDLDFQRDPYEGLPYSFLGESKRQRGFCFCVNGGARRFLSIAPCPQQNRLSLDAK